MQRYIKTEKTSVDCRIGDGAYGVVYRALDQFTNEKVALKKIKLDTEDEGIPPTALREITLLKNIRHDNVVALKDVVMDSQRLYLVFELADTDLKKYMDNCKGPLDHALVQSYTQQILEGVSYCHSIGVMHRDLKPQNILVTRNGSLKIADFGLARTFTPFMRPLTVEVITRWYRAPEVLLGYSNYTPAVDIWSVACILAEMSYKEPLLPGDSDIGQLHTTFQLLGTPTEDTFPGLTSFPFWRNNFPNWPPQNLSIRLSSLGQVGCALISSMLIYDPGMRISAADALRHPFLSTFIQTQTKENSSSVDSNFNTSERINEQVDGELLASDVQIKAFYFPEIDTLPSVSTATSSKGSHHVESAIADMGVPKGTFTVSSNRSVDVEDKLNSESNSLSYHQADTSNSNKVTMATSVSEPSKRKRAVCLVGAGPEEKENLTTASIALRSRRSKSTGSEASYPIGL